MFGKKENKIDSLIGLGTHIDGNVNFSGGLRVDGSVRGDIVATGDKPSTLVLSDQASIEGKVQVSHAIINGTVIGPLHVNEYLELQPKAKVCGDVYYRLLEIQLGATVEGMFFDQSHVQADKKVVTLIPASGD